LAWSEIAAIVLTDDAVDAELAEIDENLVRRGLSALERAEHLGRRDELLRAKGDRAPGHRPKKGADSAPFLTTAALATQVGLSERRAQEYLQIAAKIPANVRETLRPTAVAHSADALVQLARKPLQDQADIAAYLADHPESPLYLAEAQVRHRYAPCRQCGEVVDGWYRGPRDILHCRGCGNHFAATTSVCGRCGERVPNGTPLYDARGNTTYYGRASDRAAPPAGPAPPARAAPPAAEPAWEPPALTFRDFPGVLGEQFRAAWALFSMEPASVRRALPKGVEPELGRFLDHVKQWMDKMKNGEN
jgi:hypothetical protein